MRTVTKQKARTPEELIALLSAVASAIETTGVAIVCLIYLDVSGPAHMRYSVRRLRRKLPKSLTHNDYV